MHLCGRRIVPITCYLPHTYWQLLAILPFFGFFTGGIHAGYAIYFPELFPDRLRATGAGRLLQRRPVRRRADALGVRQLKVGPGRCGWRCRS